MSRYMTNMDLSDREYIEAAAKATGFNVEFRDHPIPIDYTDPEFDGYNPKSLIGIYGSVVSNEPYGRDHTPFWKEFDRLKYGS